MSCQLSKLLLLIQFELQLGNKLNAGRLPNFNHLHLCRREREREKEKIAR